MGDFLGPDWSYWLNMPAIGISDACALACGFDPYIVISNGRIGREFNDVKRLSEIAWAHIHAGTLDHNQDWNGNPVSVRLAVFRAWGESLPHPVKFPDQFPRATSDNDLQIAFIDPDMGNVQVKSSYPEELRVAIEAFEAVSSDPTATTGKSPKAALAEWLATNKPSLSEKARERIATVANWKREGGAPQTPTGQGG